MNRKLHALLVIGAFVAVVGKQGLAATIEQSSFADDLIVETVAFKLQSTAVMHYRLLFKSIVPFVAALYLSPNDKPSQALADVPKRLEIEYYYALDGGEIAVAGEKVLAANVSKEQMQTLRSRLDQIRSLYQSVTPGDRYTLTYIPGRGTELALNGKSKGVIRGADFAAAYFSIWLGKSPMDDDLKKQLVRR